MREAERTERRLDLEKAMVGLSTEEKVICEWLKNDYSQADIAREMGKSKAAVSNAVARIRDKLKKYGLEI